MKITVHPLSSNPTEAWNELSKKQKIAEINAKTPTLAAPNDKVR